MAEQETDVRQAVPEQGPARDFYDYCRDERRQRMNSDPQFDGELFDEAMELVLRKLGALETKGLI